MYETVAAMGLLGLVMSFMMGWAVWYFLTPVFTMILGFGSSDYLGNPEEGLPPRRRVYM